MVSIGLRAEIFEHSMYPSQNKFTSSNLMDLFKSLHLLSTFDYKISGSSWIEQACKHVSGFTVTEAEFYFRTYLVLLKNIEASPVTQQQVPQSEELKEVADITEVEVDVRCFGVFIVVATQLVSELRKHGAGHMENVDWPESIKPSKS